MLRLSKVFLTGAAVAALLASAPALAQNGLGSRLDAQEQQLAQAEQSCGEVNLAEYANLLNEAAQNKQRADKMAKKGVPVDMAQVNADLAKANMLFSRAQAAQARHCILQAQQAQPQPQAQVPADPQFKVMSTRPAQAWPGITPGAAGACSPAATPASTPTNLSDRARIPTQEEVNHLGELMDDAGTAGRRSEADSVLRDLDEMGLRLNKAIIDAKKVGEFSSLDVNEAEKRLKQIDDWRKAGEKFRLPCPPQQPVQPKPTQTSMNLSPFAHDALAAHNQLRSRFGAPPLQWRADLEQGATARAQQMASSHELSHAPREGRGTVRENILKAPNSYSTTEMIDLWANEANDFVPGTFPNVCKSGGECTGVYHISQMLWPTTLYVGCGEASDGGFTYTSCWYDKGGNKDGKEVGTPAAAVTGYDTLIHEGAFSTNDYGYDGALFVGYDLGSFRIEAEAAYKRAGVDNIETKVALPGSSAGPTSPPPIRTDQGRRGAWYVGGDFGAMIVEDIPFDYGLHVNTPAPATFMVMTGQSNALSFMINGMLDFGDDDGISGFVGGGVGVARVDYNNVRAFSNQGALIDDSDSSFAWQILRQCPAGSAPPPDAETKVEPPVLSDKPEIFVPSPGGPKPMQGDLYIPQDTLADCVM